MALFNSIHSSVWEDDKVLKLVDHKSKLLFIYSFTNHRCPVSGMYKISLRTMGYETELHKDCEKHLREVIDAGLVSYDFDKNVIWVHGKMKFDKSWTTKKRIKSIERSLDEFSKCSFIPQVYAKYDFIIDLILEADKRAKEFRGSMTPEAEAALEAEEKAEKEKEKDGFI